MASWLSLLEGPWDLLGLGQLIVCWKDTSGRGMLQGQEQRIMIFRDIMLQSIKGLILSLWNITCGGNCENITKLYGTLSILSLRWRCCARLSGFISRKEMLLLLRKLMWECIVSIKSISSRVLLLLSGRSRCIMWRYSGGMCGILRCIWNIMALDYVYGCTRTGRKSPEEDSMLWTAP